MKAATNTRKVKTMYYTKISIHAAREGGDMFPLKILPAHNISIHAAREGGDSAALVIRFGMLTFQSTPPVKAATAETNRRNQHFRKQQV